MRHPVAGAVAVRDRADARRHRGPVLSPAQATAARRDQLLAIALVVAAFAFGGASRADAFSQLFVRLAALVVGMGAVLLMTAERWQRCRGAVLFLLVAMGAMALQLLPLPPSWWAALPGRAPYAHALELVGLADRWRPISFTPDLTLNSLLALLPPLAAALAFGAPEPRTLRPVVTVLLGAVVVSAFISLMQLSSGGFYLFAVTNQGAGVGVFANRNHQALLLAMAFPLLAAWLALGDRASAGRQVRTIAAAAAAITIFPFLLITGSRAGLIVGVIGAGLSALLLSPRRSRRTNGGVRQLLWRLLPLGVGAVVLAVALGSSRNLALGRLLATKGGELRVENIPVIGTMIRTFLPFGTGFGSFDPMFRRFELDALLSPSYFNHAHNDLLEILLEGGVASAALLVVFLFWFIRAGWRVCRTAPQSPDDVLGRAGFVAAVLVLVASLADYPLRTPLIATVFLLCCTWLRAAEQAQAGTGRLAQGEA